MLKGYEPKCCFAFRTGPTQRVFAIQVGAKEMVSPLGARSGNAFLPATFHPASPQRRMQAQDGFVHKEEPDFGVCERLFFNSATNSSAC